MVEEHFVARHMGLEFNVCFDPDNQPHAQFWRTFHDNQWEPGTRGFLTRFLRPNDYYIDIGAWIGPLTLLAAAKGARVMAFEPDRRAYTYLQRNVDANPKFQNRISLIPAAVSDAAGSGILFAPQGTFGASTSSLYSFGGSCSGQLIDRVDAHEVLSDILMSDVRLIKIDAEGGEYKMIPRMAPLLKEYSPTLMLSLHPFVFSSMENHLLEAFYNTAKIFRCLDHYKYKFILGEDSLTTVTVEQLLCSPFGQGTLVFSQEKPEV